MNRRVDLAQALQSVRGATVRKPGPGWSRPSLNAPVWDHVSGLRVHSYGLVRMPDGSTTTAANDPCFWRTIARQGGNRKRGVMVYALELVRGRMVGT